MKPTVNDVVLELEEDLVQNWQYRKGQQYNDQFGNIIFIKPKLKTYFLKQKGHIPLIKTHSPSAAKHISRILINDTIMHKRDFKPIETVRKIRGKYKSNIIIKSK